jgi:hypothetical protein
MAGGVVEYIIGLRDQFSAAAAKVAEAAALAEKRARAMGAAANQAEAALNRIKPPAGLGVAAREMDAVAAATKRAGTAMVQTGTATRMNARDWSSTYASWRAENKALEREMRQTQRTAQEHAGWWQRNKGSFMGGLAQGGAHSALGYRGSSMLEKGMGAWMGWTLGSMAVHGADKAVTKAAEVDTMRRKLAFVLGDQGLADAAVDKAFSLSGVYQNTKVSENLEIIDDLRANLPEKFPKILEEATEPFVKLYSFWKAWDGGKHKDAAKSALKDVGLAIRSGELSGKITHDELEAHARNLSIAKAVFGEKFKMSEYFAAQKAANTAFPAMSDDFKYLGFNVLVQRLGQKAGVATGTMFAKMLQGIRMPGYSGKAWRDLGLMDESLIRSGQIELDKNGNPKGSSLAGKKWLVDQDLAAGNPMEYMLRRIFPALQKSGKVGGLDAGGIVRALDSGNVEALAAGIKAINKVDLARALGPLGYDRSAVMGLFENAMMAANILRDTHTWAQVEESMKKANAQFMDYFAAKTMAGDQADRFWQALTGKDFVPWISGNIQKVGQGFSWLADVTKQSGGVRSAFKWAGITAGSAVALAALMRITRLLGGLKKLTTIGIVLMGADAVLGNIDKIKAALATIGDGKKGTTVKATAGLYDDLSRWLATSWLGDATNAMMGGALYRMANEQRFRAAGAPWKHGADVARDVHRRRMEMHDQGTGYGLNFGQGFQRPRADLGNTAGNLAKSQTEVMVQTKVHTTFDTVKVQPSPLEIRYNGPIGGPSSVGMGGGEAHPRGTAMSEPASPKVAR